MKEIVCISGKGGTGKTSLTAAIATLASEQGRAVFADCDVDAADLHLIFRPVSTEKNEFISGKIAAIAQDRRVQTGLSNRYQSASLDYDLATTCVELCRFGAIRHSAEGIRYDPLSCEGCGVCVHCCPESLFRFEPRRCGDWYVSDSRFGPLVHAALDPRAENSGKLVTTVRQNAKRIARETNAELILVDGSPGTGCPVIASITGADAVLIVTEPTLSGQHDLERVAALARHFRVPASVCINKADINPEQTDSMRAWCLRNGIQCAGTLPWSPAATAAQIRGLSIIEYARLCREEDALRLAEAVHSIWENICQLNQ